MSRLRLIGAVMTAGLLLQVAPALAASPYPPPSKGTGRVVPSHIKAGQCAVFSGDGFAPLTPVTVRDEATVRGTTTSSTGGTFSMQLCYAADAKRGQHHLSGSGTGAGGDPLTVYAVLIVEGGRQSASNSTTLPGGTVSGPSAVSGGTSSGVQAPPGDQVPATPGTPEGLAPTGSSNSGVRLLLLGVTGLGFAFLASLLLLLIARRRRRRDDEAGPFDPAGAFA